MSQPPLDNKEGEPAQRPTRVLMDSPLAMSIRVIARRRITRKRPRDVGVRVLAVLGALLVHGFFLFGFLVGSVDEPAHLPPQQALLVRLIDAPEPPPPPPVRGMPPAERGKVHQGHASQATHALSQAINSAAASGTTSRTYSTASANVASAKPVHANATPAMAVPTPNPPAPVPAPTLQPVPLASQPPAIALQTVSVQPPVPPRFQPQPVRAPQAEGNQPMPPPMSLALPDVAAHAPPNVSMPSSAMQISVTLAANEAHPTLVNPQIVKLPATPQAQAVAVPSSSQATVNPTALPSVPAASVAADQSSVEAPAATNNQTPVEAIPSTTADKPTVTMQAPAVKVEVADTPSPPTIQPVIEESQPVAAPSPDEKTAVETPAPSSAPAKQSEAASSPAEQQAASDSSPVKDGDAQDVSSATADVSTAPNASPQGSDSAPPGDLHGVDTAAATIGGHGQAVLPNYGKGVDSTASGRAANNGGASGAAGTSSGVASGEKRGEVGSYVQLMPHGDTQIMQHRMPNVGYQATRFDKDWTPANESTVDTALRHAVEKTTVTHTFHLPQGMHVQCRVMPLLPSSLFSCGGDPPPPPAEDKAYDRMRLAPTTALAPAAAASTHTASVPVPIKLDNSVECATARVAGGPVPPGCAPIELPVKPMRPATSPSSTSWVPASDQFH